MILLCILAFAPYTWTDQLNQLETSITQLKRSLQELQLSTAVKTTENIPVSSILSKSKSIDISIKNIQKQLNQMDKHKK